jgi:uncharacterized FlaG/YvyC family protein
MEINKIQDINVYGGGVGNNKPAVKNKDGVSPRKVDAGNNVADDKVKRTDEGKVKVDTKNSHIGVSVAYAIEGDLDIVIANVKDAVTKETVRQVPSEDMVRNKKLMHAYLKSFYARLK